MKELSVCINNLLEEFRLLDQNFTEKLLIRQENQSIYQFNEPLLDELHAVLCSYLGRFFEFYHLNDKTVADLLKLKAMRANRRNARYGFPVRRLAYYLDILLKQGYCICVIDQRTNPDGGLACRQHWRYLDTLIFIISSKQTNTTEWYKEIKQGLLFMVFYGIIRTPCFT